MIEKDLREIHEKLDHIMSMLDILFKAQLGAGRNSIKAESVLVKDYMNTAEGEKVILNTINKNKRSVSNALGQRSV